MIRRTAFLIGMAWVAAGCSESGKPVKTEIDVDGRVVLASGMYLERGVVAFDPILVSGAAREERVRIVDGSFKTRMMPGKYRVAIDPPELRGPTRPSVASKFTSTETSGLEVEIKAGEDLVIRLN